MTDAPFANQTPKQALVAIRMIWVASILGEVVLSAVIAYLVVGGMEPLVGPEAATVVFYVALGLLVVVTPLGYFVRNQIYKAHWREDAITPSGYVTGNVVLLAMLEAAATAAAVAMLLGGELTPPLYVVGGAIVVQAINFPTGRPMQPTPPIMQTTTQEDR